ncbi:MAG: cytochrome c [Deltaproteobacteria bacterium]|nr:cytochrome c [Deltaproteobacteria bacterium]MBW2306003.1 cytochrome c [Deltaproteobacteria bacterium]
MTTKMAKYIFYGGTISSAILFLILTVDTHRQIGALTNVDRLSENVVAGKRVFEKYNCNDCHTMLGFGGYYAWDLTKVSQRRSEAYIRRVMSHPEKVFSKSFRKMPQQHLSDEEIDKLLAFFRWTKDIDTHDWPPQDSEKRRSAAVRRLVGGVTMSPGAALFKENNCFDCHKLQDVGGDLGKPLDDAGARLDIEKIKKWITDPQSMKADTEMPSYADLPPKDVQAIAEFLARQGG